MRGSRGQGLPPVRHRGAGQAGSRKKIKFTKAVATGNDFVVIDNRKGSILGLSKLAIRLCDRKWGVGADGLLVVERSRIADFKMRIFNSDGSEAEMCGNGSRCMALYAKVKGLARANMNIRSATLQKHHLPRAMRAGTHSPHRLLIHRASVEGR